MQILECKEEIEEAIKTCSNYIKDGGTINVVHSSFDAINFSTHDMSAVATLVNAMKQVMYYLPFIEHSDSSKEKSSMDYYNQMRYWEDKATHYRDAASEMLEYIATNCDCPLNCDRPCNDSFDLKLECWNNYFEERVRNESKENEIKR